MRKRRDRLLRVAWIPVPLAIIAIVILHSLRLPGTFDSLLLLGALNLVFLSLSSILVAYIVARSFVARGAPSLLLLGCGAIIWGAATFVAVAPGQHDIDTIVTIHNVCAFLAAACYMIGVALASRPGLIVRATSLWLGAGYVAGLGLVGGIVVLARASWVPTFFTQGQGGTPLRAIVLGAAVVLLLLSAALMRGNARRFGTGFSNWFGLALVLIATGLFGVMLQSSAGSALNWVGRGAQYLGGIYMLMAAIESTRGTGIWEASVQAALRDTRMRYEQLLDVAADGIAVHQIDVEKLQPNFLEANRAFCDLLGYTLPELRQLSARDMTISEEWPALEQEIARLIRDGRMFRQFTLCDKNGRRIPVEVNSRCFLLNGRHISVSVFRDISERKAAEAALRETEERWRTLLDHSLVPVQGFRTDGRVVYWNRASERLFGFTAAEAIGQDLRELIIPHEARDSFRQILKAGAQAASSGEIATAGEAELRAKNGTRIAVHATYTAVHSQFIDPTLFCLAVDLSERKQAEEAVRRSLRTFELLAATAGDLLQSSQPQAAIASLCRRVMQHLQCDVFFNYLLDDRTGRLHLNAYEGIPRQEAERIARLDLGSSVCGCVAEGGIPIVAEHIDLTPDSRTELVRSYGVLAYACNPLLGPGGQVIGTLSFGSFTRDTFTPDDLSLMRAVTDQIAGAMVRAGAEQGLRRSEDALRRANLDLEQKVEERTAELTRRAGQLRALAGELTLVEQRERRRLAKILHDHLQQILVAAKFRLLILGRAGDDLVREGAKEIEQLLDESVSVSRSLTAELSPPILHEGGLAAGLEWLGRWMADRYGLMVELSIDDGLPPLPEDTTVLVFEAVRELLFNSVKHAKVHSATVNVRHTSDLWLIATVSDDGPGFDPATVAPAVRTGGGFGLFSIRERLDLVNGIIVIDSAPGRGSRFMIKVPFLRGSTTTEVSVPELQIAADSARAVTLPLSARIRVLLADDHAVMREGLIQLLAPEPDIDVVGEAADGQVAIELARKLVPDVILMDLSMPKVSGIDATRIIHEELPQINIIGLSMFEESERAQTMFAAGAVGYLAKSGPSGNITAAIRAAMAESKRRDGDRAEASAVDRAEARANDREGTSAPPADPESSQEQHALQ